MADALISYIYDELDVYKTSSESILCKLRKCHDEYKELELKLIAIDVARARLNDGAAFDIDNEYFKHYKDSLNDFKKMHKFTKNIHARTCTKISDVVSNVDSLNVEITKLSIEISMLKTCKDAFAEHSTYIKQIRKSSDVIAFIFALIERIGNIIVKSANEQNVSIEQGYVIGLIQNIREKLMSSLSKSLRYDDYKQYGDDEKLVNAANTIKITYQLNDGLSSPKCALNIGAIYFKGKTDYKPITAKECQKLCCIADTKKYMPSESSSESSSERNDQVQYEDNIENSVNLDQIFDVNLSDDLAAPRKKIFIAKH